MVTTEPINISDEYCRLAMQGEPIFDHEQNLVIISIQNYQEMLKAKRNAEYLAKLDRRMKRLEQGEGTHKTMDELRAMENE